MRFSPLTALSPLDGRYHHKTEQLQAIVSEYGLIFYRVQVEIEWLIFLSTKAQLPEMVRLTKNEIAILKKWVADFNPSEADKIKKIESKTNHDVKAVEYYLQEKCKTHAKLKKLIPWIHFAATSEDINNLAYALMMKQSRDEVLLPAFDHTLVILNKIAKENASIAMLSRTHGQPATPTTLGKEFKNFAIRLKTQIDYLKKLPITGKFNGAVGNFNAHLVAYPKKNWLALSKLFVESFGLTWNAYTTQIEPHDHLSQWLNTLNLCNTILIDCARDCWGYIALHYFSLRKKESEVGSSTMPHKINPIDFENAEGNFGLANALASHFSQKLPISRWQRDLTDSTVLRNLGVIFGYTLVALDSMQKGLGKIIPNKSVICADLNNHWEILAEPIQTVLRKYGLADAYEQLKSLSRGEQLTQMQLHHFIDHLKIPADAKKQLKKLTPENYIGLAQVLAKRN